MRRIARFAFQPPQHTWFLAKLKADWACGLQQLRKVHRRVNRVAEAAYRNGQRHVANDDDAVYVDSPTTVNHYHQPKGRRGSGVLAPLLVAALWLGSLLGLWLLLSRPVAILGPQPQPAPAPSPQPAPGNAYDVSIYEP